MGFAENEVADWRRNVFALYDRVRQVKEPELAWDVWRQGRQALYRGHPQSPLPDAPARDTWVLECFRYDPSWRVEATFSPVAGAAIETSLGDDGVIRMRPFARTLGLAGRLSSELTLYWIEGYGGGVFLPFGDATNGIETYGGGRYLLDTIKGADLGMAGDRLILDFNFAYNPSCSYSSRWTCPLSPPKNRLAIDVRAGERMSFDA